MLIQVKLVGGPSSVISFEACRMLLRPIIQLRPVSAKSGLPNPKPIQRPIATRNSGSVICGTNHIISEDLEAVVDMLPMLGLEQVMTVFEN